MASPVSVGKGLQVYRCGRLYDSVRTPHPRALDALGRSTFLVKVGGQS